jgi:hypothetical protein
MIIATRVLKLKCPSGDIEVPIRIFAPEKQEVGWICRVDIEWPDEKLTRIAVGEDGVQALELALKLIGAQLYTSDHHESGKLEWLEPGQGYGFPVPNGIRDMLVGDDKRFL